MRTSPRLLLCGLVAVHVGAAPLLARCVEPAGGERLEALAEQLHRARKAPVDDVPALGAEALRLLAEAPDPATEVGVRLDLSWHASNAGDMDAGLEHARRARELAAARADEGEVARADYHVALARWYQGKPDEALATATRALEVQRGRDDAAEAATTLTLLGAVHRSRSDYDESIACHLEALGIAQRAGDVAATARSRNNIGLVYWCLGEHERAYEYIEPVVEAYRELGHEPQLATALSNAGLIRIEMDDPEGALPILEEALTRVTSDRSRAKLLGNVAFALEKLGRVDEAVERYRQTVALREELGDDWGLSRSLGSLASIHRSRGHDERALESYRRAAAAAERAEAREELATILKGLSEVEAALGRFPAAVGTLQRHVEVVQGLDRAETARRVTELESRALVEAQGLVVSQERFARNVALAGAGAFLLLGIFGWNLFRLKRQAHRNLEVLHHRLTDYASELEEARTRIEGLEELLPICAYCKSIRDEHGDWLRLESYLHDRAGATLSHGICPDCVEHALQD